MDYKARIGTVLVDRYRILDFLGRGGMGAVFLCEDMRLPGKRWAVKEMLAYDPETVDQVEESFKREAQMLSGLRHRNLPIIVDYFSVEGKQYLVMEWIEGDTLSKVITREGPTAETEALRWALELAQVLDYLHRQEKPVIFRDLKPENIIMSQDRHMKVVDFGLARQFDPSKRRDTQASGSVGYAPPEQWEDASQTDERSDIYSLGATLYYVLTGRPPSPIYGSHRLRPHRPDIEAGTEAIVLRCLQPDPSNRYSGTGELIRDLLLLLSRERHQQDAPRPAPVAPARPTPTVPPAAARALPFTPGRPVAPPPAAVPLAAPRQTPSWLPALLGVATFFWVTGAALGLIRPAPPRTPPPSLTAVTAPEKDAARQALSRKDFATAISVLDNLVTTHPEDAEAHILKANAYVLLQGKPYFRIPVLTSLTGSDQEGAQLLSGLALAQSELNQAGGVRGNLIVLDLFNDDSRLEQTLELASQIGKNPEYAVAIGPFSSQQTIAAAPVYEAAKLPDITPAASDPRVWVASKYIFTASDSDKHRVRVLARQMAGEGLLQAAVFHDEESVNSISLADDFVEEFAKLGGKVAVSGTYQESALDFRPLLVKLAGSEAQFVFLADYRSSVAARFARELRETGSGLPIAVETAAFSEKLLDLGGPAVEGMWMSTYFHPDAPDEAIQKFTLHFGQNFGTLRPTHREANAYDTLKLLAKGIEEVGFEREALRAWLASLGDKREPYPGVSGKFAPGRKLDLRQAYVVQVKDGKYVLRLPR